MKFRVKIQCSFTACPAELETWVEGLRQYRDGIHTSLWVIDEVDAELHSGWTKSLWSITCPEHSLNRETREQLAKLREP